MKITILGCGGSFGSPLAWNRHGNIDLENKRNFRTRSSVLIEYKNTNILIDTSPDLRQQLLKAKINYLDGVIFTHSHADHMHGIDDLRMIFFKRKSRIPIWGNFETVSYTHLTLPTMLWV